MKLATLKDGSRDGQLAVVSRDLGVAHLADGIAPTLQRALDDWAFIAPQLEELSQAVQAGRARHAFPFDPRRCMAPLPRAFAWVEADAAPRDDRAQARAGNDGEPAAGDGGLVTARRASDGFLGPCDDAAFESEGDGIDFGARLVAATDDLPAGATPAHCASRIRLLLLAASWQLRTPDAGTRADAMDSVAATSFAPLAVTPDELGDAWRDGAVHRPLVVHWNGRKVCDADATTGMAAAIPELLARLVRLRGMQAGGLVGAGAACMTQPATGFLRFGDRLRVEVPDADGRSVFGAIDQQVVRAAR